MDWIIFAAVLALMLFLIYKKATGWMRSKTSDSGESVIFEAELEPETVEEPQKVEEPEIPAVPIDPQSSEKADESEVQSEEEPSDEDKWDNWTVLTGDWEMSEAQLATLVGMLTEYEVNFLVEQYRQRCSVLFREVNSKDKSWESDPARKVIGLRIKLLLKAQKEYFRKKK